jgi:hypothetical protein
MEALLILSYLSTAYFVCMLLTAPLTKGGK